MTTAAGSPDSARVVAVVPAKDRADTVGATVAALRNVVGVGRVVVVDDGSGDATSATALAAGAAVLRLPQNLGKGAAVAAAVKAIGDDADVFLLVDADVGATAGAVSALLDPVLAGQADMTIAVLPPAGKRGGLGLVRRLSAAGIRRATSAAGAPGFVAGAPLSGQRAVSAALLRRINLAPRFGLEVALTVDAVRTGARVVEVPVAMEHRHTGRRMAGFSHRARQGVDIARALWPRLGAARNRVTAIVLLGALLTLAALWSGSRWEPSSVPPPARPDKVLILGLPGLSLADIGSGALPNLDRLVDHGALAAMTVRTPSLHPLAAEAYATLGAGARVSAADTDATTTFGPAGTVLVPDAAGIRRRAGSHVASSPGSLGGALHAAGLTTAVVGNADTALGLTGAVPAHPGTRRPAALALMDRSGRIDGAVVDGAELLVPEAQAPFGVRAGLDLMVGATERALATHDVVLVDPGDTERARSLTELDAPRWFVARARRQALSSADALLGQLTSRAAPGTLVLVLGMTPPGEEWRLAPAVASGPGVIPGYLHSSSTKRLGLVALTDVAPTILDALGAPTPASMIGKPLRYHPARADTGRLVRLDRDAAFRERIYYPVALGFIVFQAVLYALVIMAVTVTARARGSRAPLVEWARPVLAHAAVGVAAFPLATFLFRALPAASWPDWAWVGVLVGIDTVVVALAGLATRTRRNALAPLAWVAGVTAAVLLIDIATGARLQVASIMGYSPHSAARFFGIGNTAFGALGASAVLAAALHLERAPRRSEALVTACAFLILVVVVDGAPSLGGDVGGVLTLVPVYGLALLALSGRRITWRWAAGLVVGTVALVALAAAVDLTRAPEARTHLGRLVSDTWNHGSDSLFTTMARKAEVNIRVLQRSVWTWVVPVVAMFTLVTLVIQRRGVRLLPVGSSRRIGVLAAVGAGLLGAAANDSGVVVTALALVYVGPLLAVLVLSPPFREPAWIDRADIEVPSLPSLPSPS